MTICALSDTHGQHNAKRLSVPNSDILIFCGDFAANRSLENLTSFATWLESLPNTHKIILAGNHDWCFDLDKQLAIETLKSICPSARYIENELIEIEGIKIYGTPIQPEFNNWAFNKNSYARQHYYSRIPADLDILVTHCPPHGILDKTQSGQSVGCSILLEEVKIAKPKYHIFGHIHEMGGQSYFDGTTNFINCSLLNEHYQLVNNPMIIAYQKEKV